MEDRQKPLWPFVSALFFVFLSSCALEQDLSGNSHIVTTFRLTTPAAMEGKLTINEAYLKLDRIEVSGSLSGKNNTSLTHSIPPEEPPYRLTQADSSQAGFSVSSRAFDQLDLHLFPFTDSYQLVHLDGTGETPAPAEEPQQAGNEDTDTDEEGEQGTHDDDDDGNDGNNEGDTNNDDGSGDDNDGHDSGDSGDEGNDSDDKEDKSEDDSEDKDEDDKENDKKDEDDDKDKDEDDKDKGHKKEKEEDGDKHDHKGNGHNNHNDKDDDDDDDSEDDDERDEDKNDGNKDDDDDDDDDKDDDDEEDDDRDDRKSRNDANSVVDLDHFFQNARPGLVVFGVYENSGKTINVILVVTDVEKLSIRARQSDSFSIMLAENNTAQLSFDPAHWFESLTAADIEGATIQMYQQQNVLFIHPAHNAALYQVLVPRIEGSADLQIKAPGSENL